METVPGGTTDFGQSEHDAPHFALVAESIFANNLKLGVSVDWEGQWDSIDIGRDELMLKWSGSNSQTSCLECCVDMLALNIVQGSRDEEMSDAEVDGYKHEGLMKIACAGGREKLGMESSAAE